MINHVRGDVPIALDGVTRRLRLTFGALAEIEGALGSRGLGEMGARVARLNAGEMRSVLAALLRGAGEDGAWADDARVDLAEASRAIAAAFRGAVA